LCNETYINIHTNHPIHKEISSYVSAIYMKNVVVMYFIRNVGRNNSNP
jgi:hypothetical protein